MGLGFRMLNFIWDLSGSLAGVAGEMYLYAGYGSCVAEQLLYPEQPRWIQLHFKLCTEGKDKKT